MLKNVFNASVYIKTKTFSNTKKNENRSGARVSPRPEAQKKVGFDLGNPVFFMFRFLHVFISDFCFSFLLFVDVQAI